VAELGQTSLAEPRVVSGPRITAPDLPESITTEQKLSLSIESRNALAVDTPLLTTRAITDTVDRVARGADARCFGSLLRQPIAYERI
jgi:hypothetical protein